MELFLNPVFETFIKKAVFTDQDIIVYPNGPCPDNIINVIKFLFGEGACLEQEKSNENETHCLKIKGASYVLKDVKTLNTDWVFNKIEV